MNTQAETGKQNLEQTSSQQLKIQKITSKQLIRNDLIFYENDIWRCQSVNMQLFQNLQTKQQKKLLSTNDQKQQQSYLRIQRLELIPKEWKFNTIAQTQQIKIELKGQQLGLGPIHQIQIVGMRRFQQLQTVKSQKAKGKNIPYKVILCKTKNPKCYLIAAIDFIN